MRRPVPVRAGAALAAHQGRCRGVALGGRRLSRPTLDPARVRALRLAAQGIGGWADTAPAADTLPTARTAAVARRMLALQGQDAPGVRWSVGVRSPGLTDADVASALEAAAVVRTWPMRGTLHLLHPADVRWLLALTSQRMLATMAPRRTGLGITDDDCSGAVEAAHGVLGGRRALGRAAFLAVLDAAGISTAGQRGYHLLAWLAITGHVVLGGGLDAQPVVLLADEWLPPAVDRDPDEARVELAARYIGAHGPATAADLARWAGLPLTDARRGIAAAGAALDEVEVAGSVAYVAAGALDTATAHRGVHLLPGFDEYLLGYADRSSVLAPEDVERVVPGANGMFRPTVVVDGRVVGTWSRTLRSREVRIAVDAFPDAPAPDPEALVASAGRVGAFLGRSAAVGAASSPKGW